MILRAIDIESKAKDINEFPFMLSIIRKFSQIEFSTPVTFFVGENGSGKSTLLEAIAAAIGSINIGGEDIKKDRTLEHVRHLEKYLRLTWFKKTRKGFFLRAEDFFNFARKMYETQQDLQTMADDYKNHLNGYGLQLARGSALGQRNALIRKYGEDLNANSHGESFLKLFQERVVAGGLYLLDEPEAPLSPLRQLGFLSLLKEMIPQNSQFIIATHSPILMAFPNAEIFHFDQPPIKKIAYEEIEHVTLTRDFLNHPESFLRHL